METVVLEFQGTDNVPMLIGLLAAVTAIMVLWAGWQLLRRRHRYGLLCLAAAGGPFGAVPALLIDASAALVTRHRRRARRSLLALGALLGLPVCLVVMMIALAWICLLAGPTPAEPLSTATSAVIASLGRNAAIWLLLLAVQIALAVAVFYSAVYAHLGTGRMAGLLALRTAAILAGLLILFKPAMAVTSGHETEKPYLPILVDRSGSMGVSDAPGQANRYQQALAKLRQQEPRIGRHFRPIWHHFAEYDHQAETLAALGQTGPGADQTGATDIATPLRNAAVAYPADRTGGVVLLTDGADNVNARTTLAATAAETVVPIYTVGIGSDRDDPAAGRPGLRIAGVDAPFEAIVRNQTHLQVQTEMIGLARNPARVALLDEEGNELAAEQVYTDQPAATLTTRLAWTPRRLGPDAPAGGALRKLRIRVEPIGPVGPEIGPDQVQVHVLLTQPRIRVVYIEGSIRPEYKFLHRLLKTDPNVQFLGLIRMTGSRFWAQGSLDGGRLKSFPTTEADFNAFDVLILGDLDASYLTRTQMARIRRFVRDGGALLMLGGHNSFGPGGYGGTDVEAVLPVQVGPRSMEQEATPLVPQLTAAGARHPIFEGIAPFFIGPGGAEPTAETRLPKLTGLVSTVQAKPGTALAVHPLRRNAGGPLTVLAVQQSGAGRAAAFTADTTWQWFLPMRGLGAQSPYNRFWGQLIRWLAGAETKTRDAEPSLLARILPVRSTFRLGRQMQLLVRLQDAEGTRPENAAVTATFIPADDPDARRVTVPLAFQPDTQSYQARHAVTAEGDYRVVFSASDGQTDLGTDTVRVAIRPHSAEMETTARNQDVLDELAARSQGRSYELDGLDELVDHLIQLQAVSAGPGPETRIARLYQFAWLFAIFCALLTVEWLLRRRWQLQ